MNMLCSRSKPGVHVSALILTGDRGCVLADQVERSFFVTTAFAQPPHAIPCLLQIPKVARSEAEVAGPVIITPHLLLLYCIAKTFDKRCSPVFELLLLTGGLETSSFVVFPVPM